MWTWGLYVGLLAGISLNQTSFTNYHVEIKPQAQATDALAI